MVSAVAAEQLEQQFSMFLRRARSISGQLARELHPDLEPGAYGLMLRLREPGEARATDLASHLGIGKPTISRQLATLDRLGLITRTKDSGDGRAQVVTLTDAGKERLEKVRALRREYLHTQLQDWQEEDVEQLAGLLGRYNILVSGDTTE